MGDDEKLNVNNHLLKVARSGFAGLKGGSLVDMREVEGAEKFSDDALLEIILDLRLDNMRIKDENK